MNDSLHMQFPEIFAMVALRGCGSGYPFTHGCGHTYFSSRGKDHDDSCKSDHCHRTNHNSIHCWDNFAYPSPHANQTTIEVSFFALEQVTISKKEYEHWFAISLGVSTSTGAYIMTTLLPASKYALTTS